MKIDEWLMKNPIFKALYIDYTTKKVTELTIFWKYR